MILDGNVGSGCRPIMTARTGGVGFPEAAVACVAKNTIARAETFRRGIRRRLSAAIVPIDDGSRNDVFGWNMSHGRGDSGLGSRAVGTGKRPSRLF